MLLVYATLTTMPFSMVARRGRTGIAWIALLVVLGSLIWIAYLRSTPEARLARALDIEIPAGTEILRLRESETFGDGTTIWGACMADRLFFNEIVARHSLTKEPAFTREFISQFMPEFNIPEGRLDYSNGRLVCYFDIDAGILYFVRLPPARR